MYTALEMAQKTWIIVKFLGDDTVEAVPSNWVEGNSCYWPGYEANRLRSALKKCEALDKSWKKFAISTFGSAIYDDYAEARRKAKKAEDTSDLQSDAVSGQKRRIIPRTFSTSEDEDGDEEPRLKKSLSRPPRMARTIAVSDIGKRKISPRRYSTSEEPGQELTPLLYTPPQMEEIVEQLTLRLPPPPKMGKALILSVFRRNSIPQHQLWKPGEFFIRKYESS